MDSMAIVREERRIHSEEVVTSKAKHNVALESEKTSFNVNFKTEMEKISSKLEALEKEVIAIKEKFQDTGKQKFHEQERSSEEKLKWRGVHKRHDIRNDVLKQK